MTRPHGLLTALVLAGLAAAGPQADAASKKSGVPLPRPRPEAANASATGSVRLRPRRARRSARRRRSRARPKPWRRPPPRARPPSTWPPPRMPFRLRAAAKSSQATEIQERIQDPVARKLVEWAILRSDSNGASSARYIAFINANPSWPSIGFLRRRAESMLWTEGRDAAHGALLLRQEPAAHRQGPFRACAGIACAGRPRRRAGAGARRLAQRRLRRRPRNPGDEHVRQPASPQPTTRRAWTCASTPRTPRAACAMPTAPAATRPPSPRRASPSSRRPRTPRRRSMRCRRRRAATSATSSASRSGCAAPTATSRRPT